MPVPTVLARPTVFPRWTLVVLGAVGICALFGRWTHFSRDSVQADLQGAGVAFAEPSGTLRRHALNLGASAALGSLPVLAAPEFAYADGQPFPYDVSRGKIAKKLQPFTGTGCPDPLVTIALGDTSDGLRFIPDKINLVQGCYTELALSNPSTLEHNFVAPDFSKSVHTVVILAGSPPAELKGQAVELELKPGASLGWFLVPIKAGTFDLKCTVAGHTEGGMIGKVSVMPRAA